MSRLSTTPTWLLSLQGNVAAQRVLTQRLSWRSAFFLFALLSLSGAAYGFSLGVWRAPLQGVYAAAKFPLALVITLVFTSLLNCPPEVSVLTLTA